MEAVMNNIKFKFALNTFKINKAKKGYNNKFKNVEYTALDLYKSVTVDGYAFCVASLTTRGYTNRHGDNFESSQIIALDFDNEDIDTYVSYQEMLNIPFIGKYASFTYTTPSHSEQQHKYRVVFILDEKVEDKELYEIYVTELIDKFKSDVATKSCVQMFFGTQNCQTKDFLGNVLPVSVLNNMLLNNLKQARKKSKSSSNVVVNSSVETTPVEVNQYSKSDYEDMIGCIFNEGEVSNDEWYKTITVLKNKSGMTDDEITDEVAKYVEPGDIGVKLKNAHKIKDLGIGTLVQIAQNYGYQPKVVTKNKSKKTKPKKSFLNGCISYTATKGKSGNVVYKADYKLMLLRDQLNMFGYYKFANVANIKTYNHVDLYHIDNNIIKSITKYKIIDAIENDIIKASGFPEEVQQQLFKKILGTGNNINNLCVLLQTLDIDHLKSNLFKDSAMVTRFPFQNGYLEIDPVTSKFKSWSENIHFIYEETIIKRDWNEADDKKSEAERFFECVCTPFNTFTNTLGNCDEDKLYALKSIYGFLLTNYKDSSFAKSIFITDEAQSSFSEGGTGKSLFQNLLKQVRFVVEKDSKNYDPNSRFNFDNMTDKCDIYSLNDINKKFEIQSIYNLVTNDFSFEKKNQVSETISFSDSPKILITSNHTHVINGNSDIRRVEVFEFSNYFSHFKHVNKEFGHQLIEDWDDVEFNRFYKFCIECIQIYYSNFGSTGGRFPSYNKNNFIMKQAKAKVGFELFDFLEERIEMDKFYLADELIYDYKNEVGKDISPTMLTQRLKIYSHSVYGVELGIDKNTSRGKTYVITDKTSLVNPYK